MQTLVTYRGRRIGPAEVSFIRAWIAERVGASRRALSIAVCEAWSWRQPNGQLCDAVCRGLLLALDRGGFIVLPAPRVVMPPTRRRRAPAPVEVDSRPLVAPALCHSADKTPAPLAAAPRRCTRRPEVRLEFGAADPPLNRS